MFLYVVCVGWNKILEKEELLYTGGLDTQACLKIKAFDKGDLRIKDILCYF